MKIKFQRTGGFAGIPFNIELDTDNLEKMSGDRLVGLVEKLLPFNIEKSELVGMDLHNYDLNVEHNGQEYELHLNDAQLNDDIQELFDFILKQD